MNARITLLTRAMREELGRSIAHLRAPGHPRPYFISYLVRDVENFSLWARYGAICQRKDERRRVCFADVRVGSYRYDHVAKGGLTEPNEDAESNDMVDLPVEDGEDALRFGLWRLTDARYREAVRAFHERKSRDLQQPDENRGWHAFQRQGAERSVAAFTPFTLDREAIEKLIREASRVFRDYPEIKNSYVEFTAEFQTKVFVSTEGVERVWREPLYQLTAYMWFQHERVACEASVSVMTREERELPDLPTFKRRIRERIERLYATAKGERMTSYAGPVLLAHGPAGLFLHEVLGHRLEGNRLLSEEEGRTLKDKLGERILPAAISIVDDPTRIRYGDRSLVGAYPFDDEGTPAERVVLIEKGVLKGFLSTRSPLQKNGHRSNGHARNQTVERPISRMGNLLVESSSGLTFAALKARLIEEVRRRKLPFGIILYEVEGGETGTEAYNFQAFLGEITCCAKVYPDGREVFVRGVDFVGTPLASLATILAVGGEYEVDNSFCGAESGSVPVSTVSPALLMGNLELQAKESSRTAPYALPLPWVEEGVKPRRRPRGTRRTESR